MKRQFLATLWKALKAQGIQNSKTHRHAVVALNDCLLLANPIEQTSRAAQQHLQRACLVLAAYRVLKIKVSDHDLLLNAIGTALCTPNSRVIRNSTRTLLFFSRDPMTTLVNYTKNRIPAIYSDLFDFTNEGSAEKQFTVRVSACFYKTFFDKNNAQALTPLFCAWDMNWMEPITAQKHGVVISRETTLADGGDSCPFTFIRTRRRN